MKRIYNESDIPKGAKKKENPNGGLSYEYRDHRTGQVVYGFIPKSRRKKSDANR